MNKKAILINLLVIVGAISISGCLNHNEDETYNEQMNAFYQDLKELNVTINKLNSNTLNLNQAISEIDSANEIIDNDTQKLEDLDKSISNTTRKEYIQLWIKYLNTSKKAYNETKNIINIVKDFNDTKISNNQALTKLQESQKAITRYNKKCNSLEKEIRNYEKRYPFVLINGTTSLIVWSDNTNATENQK